jgi:hypothetical protein
MLNNLLILVATLLLIVQSAPLQIRQDIYRNTNCAGEKTGPLRTVTILLNTCFPGSRASQYLLNGTVLTYSVYNTMDCSSNPLRSTVYQLGVCAPAENSNAPLSFLFRFPHPQATILKTKTP